MSMQRMSSTGVTGKCTASCTPTRTFIDWGLLNMKIYNPAWNRTSLLTAICATLFFCPDSYAQSGSDADLVLEEVIVTAQRRETNLQTTALAVSVLTGQSLIDRGIDNLMRLQYATPSLNISDFGSANVFNIRGIGRSKVDIEIPSGVVIYQDGVPTLAPESYRP